MRTFRRRGIYARILDFGACRSGYQSILKTFRCHARRLRQSDHRYYIRRIHQRRSGFLTIAMHD